MLKVKVCSICGKSKPTDQFFFKNKARGRRSSQCKACYNRYRKTYYKRYYPKKKNEYRRRAAEYQQQRRDRIIETLRNRGCADCGERDPVVLEFDHRDPKKKEANISAMLRKGMAWSKIEAEIQKCDVVCANCHRRRTAKRENWAKLTR